MFRMKQQQKKRKGIALIVAMLFVIVFSAFSVAMFSMSSSNSIIASNLHTVNEARSSAESGLEVIRYNISQAVIPGTLPESERFDNLAYQLVSLINNTSVGSAFDHSDASEPHIHVGFSGLGIELDDTGENNFYVWLTPDGTDGVSFTVTGQSGQIDRTIASAFTYGVRKNSVFDYGVASKGAVQTSSISLDGTTFRVEADMYIESLTANNALDIKNSQIAGDVEIVNPDGYVVMSGATSIGGETGINALDHVEIGVDPTEFPYPNTTHFEQYVDGTTIDSTNLGTYTSNATLNNMTIAAGTNPTFDGNTVINGVLYVEQPNVVTIKGGTTINGVIVGNGDVNDNSGTNQIIFEGSVTSSSVASLDAATYGNLVNETGTFVMAPGFSVAMGGDFGTLNGCIACNGFTTYGNAAGTIGGSIINYSTETMVLGGNDLYFNRSGVTEVPAGFVPEIVIYYDPSAYDEVL